jgi:hypothetical protein
LPSLAGCCLACLDCAPQLVQNPDAGGILAPQYGQNVARGVPQPTQNLCPNPFCAPHLGHINICCISPLSHLLPNYMTLCRQAQYLLMTSGCL